MVASGDKQKHYSIAHPDAVFDPASREQKARKIAAVLEDALGHALAHQRVLDLGTGGGLISLVLADKGADVFALDIDSNAIKFASHNYQRNNLRYFVGDATFLPFGDAVFDVVVCAHLYEHVDNPERLLKEIRRVLTTDGICFFAAGNRWRYMEPHYSLPFLSVVPRALAHHYLRWTGKGSHYYEHHLGYFSLKRLVRSFEREDYTLRIICDPVKFAAQDVVPFKGRAAAITAQLGRILYGFLPTYIWILRKSSKVAE